MFKKKNPIGYELALSNARGAAFSFRAGDPDNDQRVGNQGVRIVIEQFGTYTSFILSTNTIGWLMKAFSINKRQAEDVYDLLLSRSRQAMRETEQRQSQRQKAQNTIPGTSLKWLSDNHQKTTTLFGTTLEL